MHSSASTAVVLTLAVLLCACDLTGSLATSSGSRSAPDSSSRATHDGGTGTDGGTGADGGHSTRADAADPVDSGGSRDGGPGDPVLIPAPLVVSPDNPRYFMDGHGRTIRLGGHQIHVDLQDHTFNKPTTYGFETLLDWDWYLDFATERGLNALRNWTLWSTGRGYTDEDRIATPMMFERTGPGLAADGLPKFDLSRFNEAFFDRMRTRLLAAQDRGIYVTLMLFEPYGFGNRANDEGRRNFDGNVFNGSNNIDGIDVDENGDGGGCEFFYSTDPRVVEIQEAYVEKVIDTVNDLDNVVYEIANEVHAPAFQRRIIAHIQEYEAAKPKQHLVYMSPGGRTRSGGWTPLRYDELTSSGAQIIGVSNEFGDYENDPPVDGSGMPAIWDGDHIWGDEWSHRRRAWMAFTRGYHFIFYDHPFERPDEATPADELMRQNIGATNTYAERFADLAAMEPSNELASSGYCLADPGNEYLVYQPSAGALTLELEAGAYDFEWYDCAEASVHSNGTLETTGGSHHVSTPSGISEDAVLYLRVRP